jgi:hypothetical protein
MFGLEDLTEPPAGEETTIAYFVLSLMQIADQAKIIHWQTGYDTEHRHFGAFYEGFIGLMDEVVEAIAGKYGSQNLKFGEAAIMVYDYDMAYMEFFKLVDEALCVTANELFDRESDSDIFSLIDDLLVLKNKTQYLLQQK